jgi:hypothetical protein
VQFLRQAGGQIEIEIEIEIYLLSIEYQFKNIDNYDHYRQSNQFALITG